MEQPKSTHWNEYFIALTATLVMLTAGSSYSWSSPTIPKLLAEDSPIPITEDEGSWIVSIMILGSVFGPIPAAFLVDKLGRKTTLLITAVPFIIGWILIIVANSVAILYTSRLLSGMSYGMVYTVMPMYLGEIASDDVRGSIGTLMTVIAKVGILVSYSIAPYVSIATFAAISLAIAVLFVVTFIWLPESPYYLLSKNRQDDALNSLQRLRGQDNVKSELNKMYLLVQEDINNRGSFMQLFQSPGNRRALIIAFGTNFCIQLCGSQAIISYASTIFDNAGGSLGASESSIILGAVQVMCATVSSSVVDKLGRRPLLLISTMGTCVTTGAVGVYFFLKDYLESDVTNIGWLPLTSLILFFVFYTVGLPTVTFAIMGEIFPTDLKAFANSFVTLAMSALGFVITKLYQVVADNWGTYVAFWIFSGFMVFGTLFVYFLVIETKGKSFAQIQAELNGQEYIDEKV